MTHRKIITVILALLALCLTSAQNVKTVGGVARANVKTVGGVAIASVKSIGGVDNTSGGAPTYLINQNFEGAGYDNSETWTASGTITPDPDSASSPIVGSQSLAASLSAQTGATRFSFVTDQGELWGFMRLRINSYGSGTQTIASVQTDGASVRASLQLTTTLTLRGLVSGGTGNATTDAMSTGVDYYVWWHWRKSSGANDGIFEGGWSTDGTLPTFAASAAKAFQSTGGTSVNDVGRYYLFDDAASHTYSLTMDNVKVAASAIPSNP